MSLLLSLLLIVTVSIIVVFWSTYTKNSIQWSSTTYRFRTLRICYFDDFNNYICIVQVWHKTRKNRAFISIGSVFTTILILLDSYAFGIWVIKFSKYNELYGSIGTLLILMFYIWINCMILLGFELNATVNKLKVKNK
jgi:membrane protein